jgi:hypothetical protein
MNVFSRQVGWREEEKSKPPRKWSAIKASTKLFLNQGSIPPWASLELPQEILGTKQV